MTMSEAAAQQEALHLMSLLADVLFPSICVQQEVTSHHMHLLTPKREGSARKTS
jgi:hypothetical protein